jgi:SWI/SNF-related matrix-associated actin-dependent regulator 1 of chromatin subfamily A
VVQSKSLKGVRTTSNGNTQIFPTTPTLLDKLGIDTAVKKEYEMLRNELLRKKKEPADIIHDKRLRPYQNIDVCFLLQFSKGIGIFNEQRTGKTPTTLVTMRIKNQMKNIIIVPAIGIYNWYREYLKWHGGPVVKIPQNHNLEKRIEFYKKHKDKTLIINYDKITTDYKYITAIYKNFDAIILDEAHEMRNFTGIRTRIGADNKEKHKSPVFAENIVRLRRISSDAYALTGTPALNKPENIYGLLRFMFPGLLGGYNQFLDYYFEREGTRFGENVYYKTGKILPEKERELMEFLELFSLQRKRKEVLPWLPAIDEEIVELETPEELLKHHQELGKYFETANISCQNGLAVMMAQRQLVLNPKHYNIDIVSPKFEWVKSFIEEAPKRPTIITSYFTSILKELSAEITTRHKLLTGETSPKQRDAIIQAFQNGKINLLIANIDVISVNITLSRAEALIIMDKSLTEGVNQQVKDRFLPITEEELASKDTHKIIYLIQKDTVDEYIQKMLDDKQSENDIINNYVKHLKGGD